MRFLIAMLMTLAPLVAAAMETLTAPEVRAAQQAGEVVLIDIRTPGEWADGGMPEGALPLTLQDPELGPKLSAILERANGKPLALICRTGARSAYLTERLREAGVTDVIDVSEGVHGSAAGPGWLKRGLPVEQPDAGTFVERLKALGAD